MGIYLLATVVQCMTVKAMVVGLVPTRGSVIFSYNIIDYVIGK